MIRERVIHLLSSFWLPLPFFSISGVDKGKEKAELWFLVGLHSMENFLIFLTSRLVYLQESYLHIFVVFDSVLVFFNLLGVLVSGFYVSKMELYAGVPEDYTSTLPSFGPEVSWLHIYDDVFTITIIYHYYIFIYLQLQFQDIITGVQNISSKEEGRKQKQEVAKYICRYCKSNLEMQIYSFEGT